MRKLLWKKAAITAMAGTMMMMTGCELQGAVNKNQTTSTAAQTSKTAESYANTQPSSVTPNTTVQVSTQEQQNQAVTEPTSPESTAQSQAPASSSEAGNVTPSSEEQEVSFSFEWITGDVPEGDGDVAWFTVDPITEDNFWVKFHGSANEEGISNVRIAVWTEANGEDDIEYIDAESLGNETKAYPVYIQNHNNEKEGYVLKVSYTNKAGEEKTCENYTRISLE
ncbi:GBS Bsp-like repeat-containing protein [Anthropogastromicrobium aceti]|uniref:GBS Bsp-like repeat-containing protein n=1 Tax=Anthropogastromicrobium aceti TaxID=2981768 RepID=A0AAE3E340_9FIRM|nr:GBS Bsp-like repeat-containing protein [Anthropogastromicrobium aceti]MCC2220521.1 GBS Bsp-like repeat-containing protein [Anthropogastromicrobium aceti]